MDYVVGSVAALITGNVTPNRPKLIRRALTPTKHQASPNVTPKSELIEDRSIFLSPTLQKKKAIVKKSPKRIFENPDLDLTQSSEGTSALTSPKAEKVKKHLKDDLEANVKDITRMPKKSPKNKNEDKSFDGETTNEDIDSNVTQIIESSPKKKKKRQTVCNNEEVVTAEPETFLAQASLANLNNSPAKVNKSPKKHQKKRKSTLEEEEMVETERSEDVPAVLKESNVKTALETSDLEATSPNQIKSASTDHLSKSQKKRLKRKMSLQNKKKNNENQLNLQTADQPNENINVMESESNKKKKKLAKIEVEDQMNNENSNPNIDKDVDNPVENVISKSKKNKKRKSKDLAQKQIANSRQAIIETEFTDEIGNGNQEADKSNKQSKINKEVKLDEETKPSKKNNSKADPESSKTESNVEVNEKKRHKEKNKNMINPNAVTDKDSDSEHDSDNEIDSENDEINKKALETTVDDNSSDEEEEVLKKENKVEKKEHKMDADEVKRTLFVGNIPFSPKCKKLIKKIFNKYGTIETVRIRTVPVKDARVTPKLAVIKNELHPERTTVNMYIKYAEPDSVEKALVENNTLLEENHLRVTRSECTGIEHDPRLAIFVGNMPFALEDDALRAKFQNCGEIESVRIIRDKKTGAGKGFGYVNFASKDGVELALAMSEDDLTMKNRILRVKRCTQTLKRPDKPNQKQVMKHHDEGAFRRIMHKRKSQDGSGDGPPNKRQNFNQPMKEKKSRKEFVGMTAEKKKKRKFDKGQKKKKAMSEILTNKS